MSTIALFEIGRSALSVAQSGLDVTANNIANVNTEGYSRQEAILEIANPVTTHIGQMGRGVNVSDVRRRFDSYLNGQILVQNQNLGKSEVLEDAYYRLEEVFNEPMGFGLGDKLSEYYDSWQEVANNPQSYEQRVVLLQRANNLATETKEIERRLEDILSSTSEEIPNTVSKINAIAENIYQLNQKIANVEGGDSKVQANDLRDSREAELRNLAELVDFQSFEGDTGMLTVTVGFRNLVSFDKANTMEAVELRENEFSIRLDDIDITDRISNGRLSGLIDAENTLINDSLLDLRRLTGTIIFETNRLHNDTLHSSYDGHNTFDLDGNSGGNFFDVVLPAARAHTDNLGNGTISASATSSVTPPLAYNSIRATEYEAVYTGSTNTLQITDVTTNSVVYSGSYSSGGAITFDGLDVTISNTLVNGDTFTISPIENAVSDFNVAITDARRIAAARSDTASGAGVFGGPGDNRNALEILTLHEGTGGGFFTATDITSFTEFYDNIVIESGAYSRSAKDNLEFEEKLLFEMEQKRDSISGVSLDEEAMSLIKFQKSYQAAARMINTSEEVMDILVNLGQ